MPFLGWGRLDDVGSEQIETDHRIISDLLIQLHDAVDTDQGRDIVANILTVIVEFTRHHMGRERGELTEHTQNHADLAAELEQIVSRWQDGGRSVAEDLRRLRPLLDAHWGTAAWIAPAPIFRRVVNGS